MGPIAIRILYVEDHLDTRGAYAGLLRSWGHTVTVAGDLAEARRLFSGEQFDLLLTDIGLPDGDGYAVLRHCRSLAPLPAIALTGYGSDGDQARMFAEGFDRFLIKPPRLHELREAICQVCSQRIATSGDSRDDQ